MEVEKKPLHHFDGGALAITPRGEKKRISDNQHIVAQELYDGIKRSMEHFSCGNLLLIHIHPLKYWVGGWGGGRRGAHQFDAQI